MAVTLPETSARTLIAVFLYWTAGEACLHRSWIFRYGWFSVLCVKCAADVHRRQHGEQERLQELDEDLEGGEDDGHDDADDTNTRAQRGQLLEQEPEAHHAEEREEHVAGEHVREQSDRVRERR